MNRNRLGGVQRARIHENETQNIPYPWIWVKKRETVIRFETMNNCI